MACHQRPNHAQHEEYPDAGANLIPYVGALCLTRLCATRPAEKLPFRHLNRKERQREVEERIVCDRVATHRRYSSHNKANWTRLPIALNPHHAPLHPPLHAEARSPAWARGAVRAACRSAARPGAAQAGDAGSAGGQALRTRAGSSFRIHRHDGHRFRARVGRSAPARSRHLCRPAFARSDLPRRRRLRCGGRCGDGG